MSKNTKTGVFFVVLLALAPAGIWLASSSLMIKFGSFFQGLTSIAQLSGLVGMALFAINIILGARIKFLEKYFNGLNNIYIDHHTVGGLAFVLLLFHPILLSARFLPDSIALAVQTLLPGFNQLNILFGLLALLLMAVLLVLTFYVQLPYNIWKWTHRFLVLAFGFAFLHLLLITSDVSRNPVLRTYMVALASLASAAAFYRSIFSMFLVRRFKYEVKTVRPLNSFVTEIIFRPTGNKMTFLPGQFVFVKFPGEAVSSEEHPFSLSSDPGNADIGISVKDMGDYTASLRFIDTGDKALLEGPFGRFSYLLHPGKEQIWIAGGIGITPFLSMARDIDGKRNDYDIDLYYTAKNSEEAIGASELSAIAEKNKNFRFIPFWSDEMKDHIDIEFIIKNSGTIKNKEIFLCGPPGMTHSLRTQFNRMGIENNRIHSEEFQL